MPSYTTTVEDILNAAIQDSQVQTTNRSTLLNYLNRVSQRILRESQWLFLQSEEQKFITKQGVSKYWIGPSPGPVDCVDTGLRLADVHGILPETVFDLTDHRQLLQDAQSTLAFATSMRYQDATLRPSRPRTYRYDYNIENVFHVIPPVQNDNLYQPIPLPCGLSFRPEGTSPNRTYYVRTTIVDSNGGESTQAVIYSEIVVPAGNQLVVHPPSLDVPSSIDVTYAFYNVYLADSSTGDYFLQNAVPISRDNAWTFMEGLGPGDYAVPFVTLEAPDGGFWTVSLNVDGSWTVASIGYAGVGQQIFLPSPDGNSYLLTVDSTGVLHTNQTLNFYVTSLIMPDPNNVLWYVSANADGSIATRVVSVPNMVQPPTTPTVVPIGGSVISFRYQRKRLQLVNPTDVLQIPDDYFDVVQAGLNYYVTMYTSKDQDVAMKAGTWKREFMDGLAQMRRDLRINNRDADFISPDRVSQRNQGVDWNVILYN